MTTEETIARQWRATHDREHALPMRRAIPAVADALARGDNPGPVLAAMLVEARAADAQRDQWVSRQAFLMRNMLRRGETTSREEREADRRAMPPRQVPWLRDMLGLDEAA